MTIQRMIELLEIEHECILRNSYDDCDRNCADCDLVQDDKELHEMYTGVIAKLKEQEAREQCLKTKCVICPHCDNCDVDENGLLKEQEPVKVKDYADIVDGIQVGYCPKCDRKIVWNPEKEERVAFCKYCGKRVKWNA